jgi:hypothetical protein
MSDIFQKDFATAMTKDGILHVACQCFISNMTPAARKAHIDAWHSKHVAELENFYLTSKYGFMLLFVFVLLSLSESFICQECSLLQAFRVIHSLREPAQEAPKF